MAVAGNIFSSSPKEAGEDEPSLANPARLVVVVRSDDTSTTLSDYTGSFVLYRDSVVVVPSRPLFPIETDTISTVLQGGISGAELATRGWYQWVATIVAANLDAVLTVTGDFSL